MIQVKNTGDYTKILVIILAYGLLNYMAGFLVATL